ncbi:MAG: nuclear transport factor 2 family protein [Halioglobus sp.]
MDELNLLVDVEKIRKLKAKYFRSMDSKDWQGLSSCFTQDLVADFRNGPGMLAEGRDNYIQQISEILKEATTIHHGHMPEIDVLSATTATGVWSMEDIVTLPDVSLQGWGHYHDHYRKEGGEWKIASTKLTRIRLLVNGEEQNV